ncbi:MAG: bifunctional 4-hydroxy-2-oxoglutarate aldolase/2-dehydro-3-deoxy-phosphogluconate aldolase [Thermaerobacter sp.]|nr:bifunctional 4-hydroxy-2-oxoglutarate aldolase/2-dehydro-3-deoxy-phosphogluconate aldolase [Thermaerobacter sp.]
MENFWAELHQACVIGIVREASPKAAERQAMRLAAGGVRFVEVSWTTPGAQDAVKHLRGQTAWVGAGTVVTKSDAKSALSCGAQFLIAPNFSTEVLLVAQEAKVPYIPGVWTPNEAAAALGAGLTHLKLFPASTGGISHMLALREPLPEICWVPTGGVSADNAVAWLEAGAWGLGMGSGLAKLSEPEMQRFLATVAEACHG